MLTSTRWLSLCLAFTLSACGGGGTTTAAIPDSPPDLPAPSPSPAPTPPAPAPAPVGQTVVVGSAAPLPPGATRVSQLLAVPWASLPAGSQVIVSPGSYNGPVTITATGTAAAPITVTAWDTAHKPVINNSVDVQASAFVSLSGLVVQSPTWGGFVIRQASHHITVAHSEVHQAPIGINISDDAGTGLVISGNLIEDSSTHGIGVAANGTASTPNLITGNTVRRSGHHGMEIRGSWWQIERNTVSASGQSIAGTSGIHLYSASAAENSGDHNLVRYNLSYNNADTGASDGNGIQVDHWCDSNTVSFNLAWGNDGAGISVYEARDNLVFGNTVRGNGLDPTGSHGGLGEIVIGSSAGNDRAANNQVFDNIAVATRTAVPALYVDGRAYDNGNSVGPNLLQNTAGGTVLRWSDSLNRNTASQIDTATGTRGNRVEAPAFHSVNSPASGGWQLSAAPSGSGLTLTDQIDLAGTASRTGLAYFGAYFTLP